MLPLREAKCHYTELSKLSGKPETGRGCNWGPTSTESSQQRELNEDTIEKILNTDEEFIKYLPEMRHTIPLDDRKRYYNYVRARFLKQKRNQNMYRKESNKIGKSIGRNAI